MRDGITLYYEEKGGGNKPLIFIHPPLMGHVVFKYQYELSGEFRCFFYDLRGHGRSGYNDTPHLQTEAILERHTNDLLELINHLDLKQVTLVGYSAAGMLALHFAINFPERVHSLILSGGFPKVDTWLLKQQFYVGIQLMRRNKRDFLAKGLALSHKLTLADFKELYQYGQKSRVLEVQALYEAYLQYDCTPALDSLTDIPILILYGSLSRHIRAHYSLFQSNLPTAKIVVIEKAFHELPTRSHLLFNHIVRQFLRDIACG